MKAAVKILLLLLAISSTACTSDSIAIPDEKEEIASYISLNWSSLTAHTSTRTETENATHAAPVKNGILYLLNKSNNMPIPVSPYKLHTTYINSKELKQKGQSLIVPTTAKEGAYSIITTWNCTAQDDSNFRIGLVEENAFYLIRFKLTDEHIENCKLGYFPMVSLIELTPIIEMATVNIKEENQTKDNPAKSTPNTITVERLVSTLNLDPTTFQLDDIELETTGFAPINTLSETPLLTVNYQYNNTEFTDSKGNPIKGPSIPAFNLNYGVDNTPEIHNPISTYSTINNNGDVIGITTAGRKAFTTSPKFILQNAFAYIELYKFQQKHTQCTAVIFKVSAKTPFYAQFEDNAWHFHPYPEGNMPPEDISTLHFPEGDMYYTFYPYLPNIRYKDKDGVLRKIYAINKNTNYSFKIKKLTHPGSRYPGGDIGHWKDSDLDIDYFFDYNTMIQLTIKEWSEVPINLDLGHEMNAL